MIASRVSFFCLTSLLGTSDFIGARQTVCRLQSRLQPPRRARRLTHGNALQTRARNIQSSVRACTIIAHVIRTAICRITCRLAVCHCNPPNINPLSIPYLPAPQRYLQPWLLRSNRRSYTTRSSQVSTWPRFSRASRPSSLPTSGSSIRLVRFLSRRLQAKYPLRLRPSRHRLPCTKVARLLPSNRKRRIR